MVKITKKVYRAWVTFTLPSSISENESVALSGSWNNWKKEPMKRRKNGDFSITKILKTNNAYEFGYSIDNDIWLCDETLISVSTPYHSKNSVLAV